MIIKFLTKITGGVWSLKYKHQSTNIKLLKNVWASLYQSALQEKGSWISLSAKFKTIPVFPHGVYGIFISGGVSIGCNCIIFQQVTIGSNTLIDSPSLGAPKIGDNCYIGAGAKIIGDVKVGRNVRIGANAVVVKDIPDNSIVIPGEQRVIVKNEQHNNFFYHRYKGKWCFFENGKRCFVTDSDQLRLLNSRFLFPFL